MQTYSCHNRDPLFYYTASFVVAAHVLLMVYCCISPFKWQPAPQNKQRIVVQTVSLKEQTTPKTLSTPVPKQEIKNPKPKIESAPPKPVSKQAPPKVEKVVPKDNTKRQELLKKAKETLKQAISNAPATQKLNAATKDSPKLIGKLQTDSQAELLSGNDAGGAYQEVLIGRLKSQLQLPEYGCVDVELTLSKAGKVLKLKVLRDENAKNRLYIEKHLPAMHFPPFDSSFQGKSEYTFVIRLSNET